jgi:WD40 repeat protein
VAADAGEAGADVFACVYTRDSEHVLSAGWDGWLRLWETAQGRQTDALSVGPKPLSACAVSADGKRWLSGSMDGMLGCWDAAGHDRLSVFLAHTRPISAIVPAPDGHALATASWDGHVTLWTAGREGDSRQLVGHTDIVAGCCFTPDSRVLFSWGHDGTVRQWDVVRARSLAVWKGHVDRVTAGAVSPDGRWFASGGRDRHVKLWDVQEGSAVQTLRVGAEVRACLFLLDGESLLVVDGDGRVSLHTVPALEEEVKVGTGLPVLCAALAPNGSQLALGCSNGLVHLVEVEGHDSTPLTVTPTASQKTTATLFQRLLGRSRTTAVYLCTCPACHRSFELTVSGQTAPCPGCRRRLRVCAVG